ncbi:MAG: hypothetical protein U9Q81_24995 [Pseudomonadota bacterium]|nr:hypothetical protein [Pseudomonadota bacterium]
MPRILQIKKSKGTKFGLSKKLGSRPTFKKWAETLVAGKYGMGYSKKGDGKGGGVFVVKGSEHHGQSPVPLPPAFWLFASGVAGLMFVSRRQKKKSDSSSPCENPARTA